MSTATSAPRRTGAPPSALQRPGVIRAWYLYDVAISVIDALMITFVFSTFLTSGAFGPSEHASQVLGWGSAGAAVLIALLSPLVGWLSDRTGRRGPGLALFTGLSVLATAACFLVEPRPAMLWLGVALLSAANAFKELAVVDYYAVLPQLASPERIGRLSGRGWGAGYIGSILATAFVLFGFVSPGFLGLPAEQSLNVRAVALFCAAWCAVMALPLIIALLRAEHSCTTATPRSQLRFDPAGPLIPYREVLRLVRSLWRTDRSALAFLLASAVFRDGLSGVFTFGGVLAAGSFGFSLTQVMLFAIAGNLVAGVGALVGGQLDDRLSPKAVIVGALALIIVMGLVLLAAATPAAFWVCGLTICVAVGPAQAASRSYLGRLTSDGEEGTLYGLYATTGRAASFLAPALFALGIAAGGDQLCGLAGILLVLAAGLALTLPLPSLARDRGRDRDRAAAGRG